MTFDLVHRGNDCCELEELCKVLHREVRHPDRLHLLRVLLEHLLHRPPSVAPVVVFVCSPILHRRRPVHQPEVEVRRVELGERVLERGWHITVVCIAQLRRQEDLFAWYP